MGRTMQTARKGPQQRRHTEAELDQLEVVSDRFSLPAAIKSIHAQTSASETQPSPQEVEPDHNYHVRDIRLPKLFQLVLETLDVPKDEITGKLREVLDDEAKADSIKVELRSKKAAKIKQDMDTDGIEVLDDHSVGRQADKSCLLFYQKQEVRIGVPITLSSRSGTLAFEESSGSLDTKVLTALTAMVQSSVGDHEKLFLSQNFCLKRQSDMSGQNVEGKSVVVDDEFQDTSLFGYRPLPYTEIERCGMTYTSCTPANETSPRHWVESLDALLSVRNQHDQPFSTRIKLYLVNRPETIDGGPSKQFKNFMNQCPSVLPHATYHTLNRGVWKSLRIGLIFEMHANPAKMYIRPSNVVALNNRRIIMQAVYPGPYTVRALAAESNPSGIIKLETFYANLLPAPRLSSSLDEYQPEGMTAKLLPFQLRTVAWLVDR